MKRLNTRIAQLCLLSSLFMATSAGCTEAKKSTSETTHKTDYSFNDDSVFHFVERQVAFGPRIPGTVAQNACANYFEQEFKKWGAQITRQQTEVTRFDGVKLPCINITASIRPELNNRILLCAHWDSRFIADHDPNPTMRQQPVMGANDGASGVAVLMEIARQLQNQAPSIGVDLLLLDCEDQGVPEESPYSSKENTWCLGTQAWAQQPSIKMYRPRFGILLDMVGRTNAQFYREQISDHYAPGVVSKVWKAAEEMGFANYFINKSGGAITDDHLYINQLTGIPCIDIIDYDPNGMTGFFAGWHTTSDTIDKIDKTTLSAVGKTLLKVIYQEK